MGTLGLILGWMFGALVRAPSPSEILPWSAGLDTAGKVIALSTAVLAGLAGALVAYALRPSRVDGRSPCTARSSTARTGRDAERIALTVALPSTHAGDRSLRSGS